MVPLLQRQTKTLFVWRQAASITATAVLDGLGQSAPPPVADGIGALPGFIWPG
jgi:hypothetical protein